MIDKHMVEYRAALAGVSPTARPVCRSNRCVVLVHVRVVACAPIATRNRRPRTRRPHTAGRAPVTGARHHAKQAERRRLAAVRAARADRRVRLEHCAAQGSKRAAALLAEFDPEFRAALTTDVPALSPVEINNKKAKQP